MNFINWLLHQWIYGEKHVVENYQKIFCTNNLNKQDLSRPNFIPTCLVIKKKFCQTLQDFTIDYPFNGKCMDKIFNFNSYLD